MSGFLVLKEREKIEVCGKVRYDQDQDELETKPF